LNGGAGINWAKTRDIAMSLLLSPAFGFFLVMILMYLFRMYIKNKNVFDEPDPDTDHRPPFWIRVTLISTCTLVSFFHGSNDGQKGVGMLMIILLAIAPLQFSLNPSVDTPTVTRALTDIHALISNQPTDHLYRAEISDEMAGITALKIDIETLDHNNLNQKLEIRKRTQLLRKNLKSLLNEHLVIIPNHDRRQLKASLKVLENYTDYAPLWAIGLIALSLGLGTMIGWKRIVVTIGEKIGKTHLTYAQGAAAELAAAATIGLSTGLGLPVSTTHVLSSGVAGSMVASNGMKNLQRKTITSIGAAWLLTLPVTMVVSALLYFLFRFIALSL
jgi:PiT family inorganic phosphate transporter